MPDRRIAKIIHQCAKMLVALLEKEYGFGKKPDVQVVHRVDVWGLTRE